MGPNQYIWMEIELGAMNSLSNCKGGKVSVLVFLIVNCIYLPPFRSSDDLMATLSIWDTSHHKVIHGMVWQVEPLASANSLGSADTFPAFHPDLGNSLIALEIVRVLIKTHRAADTHCCKNYYNFGLRRVNCGKIRSVIFC